MGANAERKPNKLIQATSPYLLQHAHNPVAWEEWGEESLQRAIREDKPILVSIGYSSCHWCHVMERESFENETIAGVMNANFVCIKVDREERPDIDQIYMEAVQALGVNGGWPLNVFLTPDQKPFYGGTYFQPKSWLQLLQQLSKAFQQRRSEINDSAAELASHLNISDLRRFSQDPDSSFAIADFNAMFASLESKFDKAWGGIEKAPKFIMPTIWQFLLRYHSLTSNKFALEMVEQTLLKAASGGIYDQIGGGFARYSVDGRWFAPHFEKMLYDNAQLLSLYAEAFAATRKAFFKEKIYETVGWLQREMRHPAGGFYSALDADSEGIEGKYYTWTTQELYDTIGERAKDMRELYGVMDEGNWEHGRNILTRQFENQNNDIRLINELLLEARANRIRPQLDDKVVTGWNAMTICGLLDAYKALGDGLFLTLAEECVSFIEKSLIEGDKLFRSFKGRHSNTEGFLEDHAFLIQAYWQLYETTFNESYLTTAGRWCQKTIDAFFDEEEKYFHFTSSYSERLVARKKEIFDNVIPASNSVMARNLFTLGTMLDRDDWKEMSKHMVSSLARIIVSEPTYMSNWGIAAMEITKGLHEVVISGEEAEKKRKELGQHFLPFAVTLGSTGSSDLPLLKGREAKKGSTAIYVCYQKTCQLPVFEISSALSLLSQ